MSDIDRRLELIVTGTENLKEVVGLHTSQIKKLQDHELDTKEEIASIKEWQQHHDETEFISKDQRRRMKSAVYAKVNELLGIKYIDGAMTEDSMSVAIKYRTRFIHKCWLDSAKFSVVSRPYDETLSRNYDEGMAYISNWEPELSYKGLTGAAAFKLYIDDEREAKVKS